LYQTHSEEDIAGKVSELSVAFSQGSWVAQRSDPDPRAWIGTIVAFLARKIIGWGNPIVANLPENEKAMPNAATVKWAQVRTTPTSRGPETLESTIPGKVQVKRVPIGRNASLCLSVHLLWGLQKAGPPDWMKAAPILVGL
jgi:hypothetical protein